MTISYSMPELNATRGGTIEGGDESTRRSRGRVAMGHPISLFKRWRRNAYIVYNADEIIHDTLKHQPKALLGNPSYLRLVAETLIDQGIDGFHPKALGSRGEVLDEPTRQFLESTFGCGVFNG